MDIVIECDIVPENTFCFYFYHLTDEVISFVNDNIANHPDRVISGTPN